MATHSYPSAVDPPPPSASSAADPPTLTPPLATRLAPTLPSLPAPPSMAAPPCTAASLMEGTLKEGGSLMALLLSAMESRPDAQDGAGSSTDAAPTRPSAMGVLPRVLDSSKEAPSSKIGDGFSTPEKCPAPTPFTSFVPDCDDEFKPVNMKFAPFTGVNQHLQSVFLGGAFLVGIEQHEGVKIVTIHDGSMRDKVVHWWASNLFGSCSCKLFEMIGIPCCHIIVTLRGEKISELPSSYILKRWEKKCKREIVFDDEGNLLEEKPVDANEVARRRKIATVRNKIEDLIQKAKSSNDDEGLDFLLTGVMNLEDSFGQIVPSIVQTTQEEYESFIGCRIPQQVEIHPPTDVRLKGRSKRIKKAKELPKPRKRRNANNSNMLS